MGIAIKSGSGSDTGTMVNDAAAAVSGVASVGFGATELFSNGELAPALFEIAGDILGPASLVINGIALAETVARGRDAKIAFRALTKAIEEESDPLVKQIMVEAAAQNKWETNRRIGRGLLTAAAIGLTAASIATGGIGFAVATGVIGFVKAAETIWNYYKKKKAAVRQKKDAAALIDKAIDGDPPSVKLLESLGIALPESKEGKQYKKSIGELAPFLGRSTEEARKAAMEKAAQNAQQAGERAALLIAQLPQAA
jgi:hypothetical protein